MWPPVNSQQERGDLSPTARRKKTLPVVRARPGLGRDPQPLISLLEALSENQPRRTGPGTHTSQGTARALWFEAVELGTDGHAAGKNESKGQEVRLEKARCFLQPAPPHLHRGHP